MREIKFRAWDGRTLRVGELEMYDDQIAFRCQHFECDPEEVVFEQFTGLRDKNGREIYEGDIWRVETGSQIIDGVSEKRYTKGAVSISNIGIVIGTTCMAYNRHIWGNGVGEVIGNIHENPELV